MKFFERGYLYLYFFDIVFDDMKALEKYSNNYIFFVLVPWRSSYLGNVLEKENQFQTLQETFCCKSLNVPGTRKYLEKR